MADAPTDDAASVAALFMLPIVEGVEPLFSPMQYSFTPVKSPAIIPALIKWTVMITDVLVMPATESCDTTGRVESIVGADVGELVGEKAVARVYKLA